MGSKETIRRQIGMAVPPEGVRYIFEAVLRTFAGISYASVAPTFEVLRPHGQYSPQEAEQLMLLEKEARLYGRRSAV
jgi:DNA (cytosine-5)-methyltransferase 1